MSERRPKKRPNVFAQVVANADEVVQASFIASGPAPAKVDAAAAEDTFAPPPVAPSAAPVPDPVTAPHIQAADSSPLTGAVVTQPAAPAAGAQNPVARRVPQAEDPYPVDLVIAPTTLEALKPVRAEPGQAQPKAPAAPEPLPSQEARPALPTQEPAGLPLREAEPASKALPRRRPVAARRSAQHHWSHQAVFESYASAMIESKNWRLHGFRIVPDVLAQLKTRINADRRSTGNVKLAISHYIDAALRHASADVEEQVALAQEFLTARMGMVEAGKQSTYRVGPQASAWVADLNVGLQEADYGRKGIYVVSASIESFLEALDGAGVLERPEVPGVR